MSMMRKIKNAAISFIIRFIWISFKRLIRASCNVAGSGGLQERIKQETDSTYVISARRLCFYLGLYRHTPVF